MPQGYFLESMGIKMRLDVINYPNLNRSSYKMQRNKLRNNY